MSYGIKEQSESVINAMVTELESGVISHCNTSRSDIVLKISDSELTEEKLLVYYHVIQRALFEVLDTRASYWKNPALIKQIGTDLEELIGKTKLRFCFERSFFSNSGECVLKCVGDGMCYAEFNFMTAEQKLDRVIEKFNLKPSFRGRVALNAHELNKRLFP